MRKHVYSLVTEYPCLYIGIVLLSLVVCATTLYLGNTTENRWYYAVSLIAGSIYCVVQVTLNWTMIVSEAIFIAFGRSQLFGKKKANFHVRIRWDDCIILVLVGSICLIGGSAFGVIPVIVGFIAHWAGRLIAAYG
ncbi:MAG: hypothetical protein H6765_02595 [Candidatus Peribacteria bacterium]|nr:MAG: hypothetical protein H6765_02595 [Candidatus Peribacteria bacterium]